MRPGLALIAIAVLACDRAAPKEDPLQSNFAAVKLDGARILDAKTGQPYTGTVVARDREIAPLAQMIMAGTPFAESTAPVRLDGLILVLPVSAGVANGRAVLHIDLRAPRLDNEVTRLHGQIGAEVAKVVAPTAEVGEATLIDGKLNGNAVVLVPSAAFSRGYKLGYARFKDNQIDGDSIEYYPGTDQPHHERRYVAGVRTGRQRSFFRDGTIASESNYDRGNLHGELREYYPNHAMRARRTYDEHGREIGTAEWWFPNGARRKTLTYDADFEPTGTEWTPNGAVVARWTAGHREDVPIDGDVEEFFDSGKPMSRTRYTAGVKDGPYEVLYADGAKREAGSYARGVQTGPQRKWWPSGKPALTATWVDGALDGAYTRWYADGTPWEQATYAAGKLDGRYRKWWRNGVLAHDYRYDHGKLQGDYRQYYDSGQVWMIGAYDRGRPQGVLLRWFPGGQLGYELHHVKGRPHGPFRRWYASGQPRETATYANGMLEGERTSWNEDGSLHERATYHLGMPLATTRQ